MRALVLALLLVGAVLVVVLVVILGLSLTGRRPTGPVRWVAVNTSVDGSTVVVVQLQSAEGRALESRNVTAVRDNDPDYDAQLLEAMAQARSRAALLNGELG